MRQPIIVEFHKNGDSRRREIIEDQNTKMFCFISFISSGNRGNSVL